MIKNGSFRKDCCKNQKAGFSIQIAEIIKKTKQNRRIYIDSSARFFMHSYLKYTYLLLKKLLPLLH